PFSIEFSGGFFKIKTRSNPKAANVKSGKRNLSLHHDNLIAMGYEFIDDIIETGKHITVISDDLDLHWNGSANESKSLQGLFGAIQPIRDALGEKISILIFIRSDMYDILDLQHDIKHFAMKHELKWDNELINNVMEKRLMHWLGEGGKAEDNSNMLE